MRLTFAAVAAALVTLGTTATSANAQAVYSRQPQNADVHLVDSWYRHYLGRPVDEVGLQSWLPQLANGNSEAGILGSPEYYNRHGGTPQGFVAGLYVDVLGRQPGANEVQSWVARLQQIGWDRIVLSDDFLSAADTELNLRSGSPGYTPAAPQIVVQEQPIIPYVEPGYVYGSSGFGIGRRSGYWGGNRFWGGSHYGRGDGGHGLAHHSEGRHGHR
jgi:Domain of unknown function (DUF4214)